MCEKKLCAYMNVCPYIYKYLCLWHSIHSKLVNIYEWELKSNRRSWINVALPLLFARESELESI